MAVRGLGLSGPPSISPLGQRGLDAPQALALIGGPGGRQSSWHDTAYDSDQIRKARRREKGRTLAVIPNKSPLSRPKKHPTRRNTSTPSRTPVVECCFSRL